MGRAKWGHTGASQGIQMLSTGINLCKVHQAVGETAVL